VDPKSAQTLVVTAFILAVLGFAVMNPTAGILGGGLSALCGAIAALFARGGWRIGGAVALLAALGLIAARYPEHEKLADQTQQRLSAPKPAPKAP
jgi:hypothetical protein